MLKLLITLTSIVVLHAQTATIAELQTSGIVDRESIQMIETRIFEIASHSDKYRTMSQDKQRRAFSSNNILLPSYCDEICWSEIAEQIGTDLVIAPTLSKDGRYLLLEVKLIEAASQKAISQTQVYISGGVSKSIETALSQLSEGSDNEEESSINGEKTQWVTGLSYVAATASAIWLSLSYLSIKDDSNQNSITDQSALPANF